MARLADYRAEFGPNWRVLLGAMLGLGGGLGINTFAAGLFIPHLAAEFGWSPAQLALTGIAGLITLTVLPIIGRLTDLFGPRRIAMLGVATIPLCYGALSLMHGDVRVYWLLEATLIALGATTTSTVYTNFVAARFDRGRGLALAMVIATPAAVAALLVPTLAEYIRVEGWREGYRLLAVWCLVCGIGALILLPRQAPVRAGSEAAGGGDRREVYRLIAGTRAFWIVIIAMLLCNIPATLGSAQMKPMLLAKGFDMQGAAQLISLYATGIILGRIVCGFALDRFPAHIVAAVLMGIPALGLLILGLLGPSMPPAVVLAVLMIGVSQGAEGDIAAYLASRYFRHAIFSSVLGLIVAALSLSAAIGAATLAGVLAQTGSFVPFIVGSSVSVMAGALMFLLLGRNPAVPFRSPSEQRDPGGAPGSAPA